VGRPWRDGLFDGVEDRDAVDVAPALAGGYAADDLGTVVAVAQAVKTALSPGESLGDHLGVSSTKILMSLPLVVREGHGPAGGVQHRGFSDQ